MTQKTGGGWTSPQVVMAAIGIVTMTAGSYLAIQRDDTKETRAALNDHARRVAIMETRLEYLANELREQRQRPDRQRE